jgi:hypothetical protein
MAGMCMSVVPVPQSSFDVSRTDGVQRRIMQGPCVLPKGRGEVLSLQLT